MPLTVHPDALGDIPQQDIERVLSKIEWLWANRMSIRHYPLTGNLSGFYRRRLGKYRIIYTYSDNPTDMVIRLVGTRDGIYDMNIPDP